jgi:hypothetical protein
LDQTANLPDPLWVQKMSSKGLQRVKLRLSGRAAAWHAHHRMQTSIDRREKCWQYPTLKPTTRGVSEKSVPRIAFQESDPMPNVVDRKVVCL